MAPSTFIYVMITWCAPLKGCIPWQRHYQICYCFTKNWFFTVTLNLATAGCISWCFTLIHTVFQPSHASLRSTDLYQTAQILFVSLVILSLLSTFPNSNLSFKRWRDQNSIQCISCRKMSLHSSNMMLTSCSLFSSTWSDSWLLLSWSFLLSIINPRFFSAVVMTTSEPIILWNDRICVSCCYCFLRVHFFTFVYTEFCCCYFFGQSSIYIFNVFLPKIEVQYFI